MYSSPLALGQLRRAGGLVITVTGTRAPASAHRDCGHRTFSCAGGAGNTSATASQSAAQSAEEQLSETQPDPAPTGRGRRAAAVHQGVEVLLVAEEAVAPRGGEEAAEAQQQPRHGDGDGDGEPGRGVTTATTSSFYLLIILLRTKNCRIIHGQTTRYTLFLFVKHGYRQTEREDASKLVCWLDNYLAYYLLQIETMKIKRCTLESRYFIIVRIFPLPSQSPNTPMIYLASEVFTVSPVEGW